MPKIAQRITPFLWFDDRAEEAVRFYSSIFEDSGIARVSRYGEEGARVSGRPAGSVMTIAFRLAGQEFVALNGGPHFRFNEAVSFVVSCDTQDEVDRYWEALAAGGDPKAQQCGWLKDRFGLSWQIVPTELEELLAGPDAAKASRTMQAMLGMKKLDLEALRRA